MYFNEKEDTNIDKEFKNKTSFSFEKIKKPLIIIGIILVIFIIILIIIGMSRNKTNYFITLEGSEVMTIYQDTKYTEPGYRGFDNKQKSYDVEVSGEVDSSKIGTYTITYTLRDTTKTRTVNVIAKPTVVTVIHLNGNKNMTIKVGEKYIEPGYTAIDASDGDLTSKVTLSGKVDTSKKGTYRIVYSVVNSSGVTTSESRVVVVK